MHEFFVVVAAVLTSIILIPLYRVVKGPTVFDRLLGANAIGTKTLVLVCLLGFVFERVDVFVDITLAYAVLNFIGVIAMAKFFETHKARE
jgi:multicomponent Na+:H+ antiporter subunit F